MVQGIEHPTPTSTLGGWHLLTPVTTHSVTFPQKLKLCQIVPLQPLLTKQKKKKEGGGADFNNLKKNEELF